jgi:uncharacterized protein YidB (DUF937 family)
MGLLDEVGKALGGGALSGSGLGGAMGGGGQAALLQALTGLLAGGGLDGLLRSFQQKGMGDLVGSWVSTGPNLPASADQIRHGLGPDLLSQLAGQTGMAPGAVAGHLSELLPGIVDRLTPQGNLPDAGSMGGLLEGVLGGLLK